MTSAPDIKNPRYPPKRTQNRGSNASLQKRSPLRERSSSETNELPPLTARRHHRQSGSYDDRTKHVASRQAPASLTGRSYETGAATDNITRVTPATKANYGVLQQQPPARIPDLTKNKSGQRNPGRINTKDNLPSASPPSYEESNYKAHTASTSTPSASWFSPTTATPPTSPPRSSLSSTFPFPAVPSQGVPPVPVRRRSLLPEGETRSPDAQTVPVVLSSSPASGQPEASLSKPTVSTDPLAATKLANRRSSGARYTAFPPPLKSPKRQSLTNARDPNRASVTSIGPGNTPIDFFASSVPWPMNQGSVEQNRPVSNVSRSGPEAAKSAPLDHLSIQHHPLRQSPTNPAWGGPQPVTSDEPLIDTSTTHQSRQAWSAHLSTIHSESERTSRSVTEVSSTPGAHTTVGPYTLQSHASSGVLPAGLYNTAAPLIPAPLFSPPKPRHSEEERDMVSSLPTPMLRSNQPAYANRMSVASNFSARSSYMGDMLPPWVQLYYSQGGRESMIERVVGRTSPLRKAPSPRGPATPESDGPSDSPESDTIPIVLTRPRNRPYEDASPPRAGYGVGAAYTADMPVRSAAMAASAPYHDDGAFLHPRSTPRPAMQVRSPSASPYLQQDQRTAARLSAWQVPSLDEPVRGQYFSRCNRQIILFCLGFLFPPFWMVAAVLPLPYRPEIRNVGTPSELKLEKDLATKVGPIDERRFAKARWWRRLNSIMSVIGFVITGIMVGLFSMFSTD